MKFTGSVVVALTCLSGVTNGFAPAILSNTRWTTTQLYNAGHGGPAKGAGGMFDTRDPAPMKHEDPRKSISEAPSFEEYLRSRQAAAGGGAVPAAPKAPAPAPAAPAWPTYSAPAAPPAWSPPATPSWSAPPAPAWSAPPAPAWSAPPAAAPAWSAPPAAAPAWSAPPAAAPAWGAPPAAKAPHSGAPAKGAGGMFDTRDPTPMKHEDPRKSISEAPSFEEYMRSRQQKQ